MEGLCNTVKQAIISALAAFVGKNASDNIATTS